MNCSPFRQLIPVGEQTLTVSSTAVGFTQSNARETIDTASLSQIKARYAFCTVEDQPIRWSVVGTPQAGTGGHEYAAGTNFWLSSDSEIATFKAIRTGGTDGLIHVTFYA